MAASSNASASWRRGTRGEWVVVAQFAAIALVVASPLTGWRFAGPAWLRGAGAPLIVAGAAVAVWAVRTLRENLVVIPHPRPGGYLVTGGPYRVVRHPIYTGLLCASAGYALARQSWAALGAAAVLCIVLDLKARFEERRLRATYAGYAEYQRRTRRFIPLGPRG